jgi:hypothetical protein
MTEEASGVKISEGDWKSLNNRLEAIDKSLKSTTTTITDQGKKIVELSTPVQNIVQVRINQYNAYDTTSVSIPVDDTIPQSNEGKKFMDVMITPKSEKNILIIEALAVVSSVVFDTNSVTMALFQSPNANALAAVNESAPGASIMFVLFLKYKMIAGTKESITFNVNIGPSGAWAAYFNGGSAARRFGDIVKSYIQVTEVLEAATI